MKKIIFILTLASTPVFAQQADQSALVQALAEQMQRTQAEAVQLRARVIVLEKELSEQKSINSTPKDKK